MKNAFAQLAFGLGANALVARDAAQQCIQVKASGGASGVLGQLGDGQNRIGGGNPTGCYCLSNGGFTDSNGRGCILTPPTTQFQCDVGASPTTGFGLDSNGGVTYNGSGTFYACPVNDNGEYNVYTQPAPGQDKCVNIALSSAGSCGSSAAPPPQSAAPAPSASGYKPVPQPSQAPAPIPSQKPAPVPVPSDKPAPAPIPSNKPAPIPSNKPAPIPSQKPAPIPSQKPAPVPAPSNNPAPAPIPSEKPAPAPLPSQKPAPPAASPVNPAPQPVAPAPASGSCPADLNGAYEYPHLIIPVDSSSPNSAPGTSYNGKVNSHTCSIFNFDIPASYAGKTCSVVFLFPQQKDLETSSFTVSGTGKVDFSKLAGAANQQTSYANQPAKASDLGSFSVAPGGSYVVASGACAAGQTVSYEMCGQGDFALEYFQDYNPSPIGLYVRQC
jgi:hypothetical protein